MIQQSKGIIHLSSQRGHIESATIRKLMTFNHEDYHADERKPFGALKLLNDETLAPGESVEMQPGSGTLVAILPIVGNVNFNNNDIQPGQILFSYVRAGEWYTLKNEHDELINYLQIWIENKSGAKQFELTTFNISDVNNLLPLENNFFIGKYNGRKKGEYILKNARDGIYAFVIQGAFEVQDRLLEARDGLALWEIEAIDFEALSEEAILLLIEVPM